MQRVDTDRVDLFCIRARDPIYSATFGQWFSYPLPVRARVLDLVHKLEWQHGEGADMWHHYTTPHYSREYLMPLFDLAASVWEARHWLTSRKLESLNYVPVYRTSWSLETEFRAMLKKFAHWRQLFYERQYPNTFHTWFEPFPERVANLPSNMSDEDQNLRKLQWRREAIRAAKSWILDHPFTDTYDTYEDAQMLREHLWRISVTGEEYFVSLPGARNRFMLPLMPSAYEFPEVSCQKEFTEKTHLKCVCKSCEPTYKPYRRCQLLQAWSQDIQMKVRCWCVGCNFTRARYEYDPDAWDAKDMYRNAVPQALGRNPFRWETQVLLKENFWPVHEAVISTSSSIAAE